MAEQSETVYVQLKQAVYREYSRSYGDDRKRFVGGRGLAERVDWALEPLTKGTDCWTWAAGAVTWSSGRWKSNPPSRRLLGWI